MVYSPLLRRKLNMAKKVTKIYAMPGYTQYSVAIPFLNGASTLRVNFSDAMMDAYNTPMAKAEIKTPIYQEVIEGSALFKSGKIILLREVVEDADVANGDESKKMEYADVKNYQQARGILMRQHGISIDLLQGKEAILREAENANVSFPNLKP